MALSLIGMLIMRQPDLGALIVILLVAILRDRKSVV